MTKTDKGPGYMSPDIMGCQFSIYPLRQDEIGIPIRAAVEAARAEGCSVRVSNLSTLLAGSEEQVFAGLRAAFRAAQQHGSTVMVATFAAGPPTDELVGEIQQQVDGLAAGAGPSGAEAGRSAANVAAQAGASPGGDATC
ncbi:MAG: hypothetical protein JW990_04185 [Thermoleophilia bacterium]|nr:hypothetical protein [Thermoleophilia bacterium]